MATTTQISSCVLFFKFIQGRVLNNNIASVTTAVVIGLFVILAIIVGILAWTCPPPSAQPRHQVCNTEADQFNNQRALVMYPNETPPCGFRNVFGRRSLTGFNEVMESIRISPSNPAIFGDGKCAELSMKVVLTPPTPSRNGDSSVSKWVPGSCIWL